MFLMVNHLKQNYENGGAMKTQVFPAILIIFFLSACNGTFEVGIEHSIASIEAASATDTPGVVETKVAGTLTAIQTATPVTSPTVTFTTEPASVLPHDLYYSAEDSKGKYQIFRLGRDGKTIAQITFEQTDPTSIDPGLANLDLRYFDVSPIGGTIVYCSNNELISVDANGSNRSVLVKDINSKAIDEPAWSPDGQTIAYHYNWKDIYLYSISTGKSALLLTGGDTDAFEPVLFSPDGKKLLIRHAVQSFDAFNGLTKIYDFSSGSITDIAMWTGAAACDGDLTWISPEAFFCYYHMNNLQNSRSGLWRVNANDGALETLLAPSSAYSTTEQIPLVVAPRQDEAGNLIYLYGEGYPIIKAGLSQPVSLVHSDADGVTNRVALRPEKFLVDNAIWTPDGKAIVIYQAVPAKNLLFVPIDPSLPVVTLPVVTPLSDTFLPDDITFRWKP